MSHVAEMIDGSTKRYFSCAETAQFVRAALKKEFPGVKFSVRSKTYSGGASIDVSWVDGPTASQVEAVTGIFSGADFDGMVDLKVYASHWMHPDGTVVLASRPGTNGSFGEILGDPVGPTAELVHFGADFVFTRRELSDEFKAELVSAIEEDTQRPWSLNEYYEVGVRVPESCKPAVWTTRDNLGRAYTSPGYGQEQVRYLAAMWDRRETTNHS